MTSLWFINRSAIIPCFFSLLNLHATSIAHLFSFSLYFLLFINAQCTHAYTYLSFCIALLKEKSSESHSLSCFEYSFWKNGFVSGFMELFVIRLIFFPTLSLILFLCLYLSLSHTYSLHVDKIFLFFIASNLLNMKNGMGNEMRKFLF